MGTLIAVKDKYTEKYCFYFDKAFPKLGWDISPLRASIKRVALTPIYGESNKAFSYLPSFIADSLPDRWGDQVFARWAAAREIPQKELSPLDRLAYIGLRGMGALEFVPSSAKEMEEPFRIELGMLHQLSKSALEMAGSFKANIYDNIMLESLFKVGTSAGGKRPKAIINYNPSSGVCYSGQVAAPEEGCIPMIIKFDEHSDVPTTRIEYAYWLMAQAAEMRMMPSSLIQVEDGMHFLTHRFDRTKDGEKLHVQTLAALDPGASSYEELFSTALALAVPSEDKSQLFLQVVMNVLCGNVDDHSKNFSFIMDQSGNWRVAPAYDFTFTIDPSAPRYVNRHSLSLGGKDHDITRADLLTLAREMDIKGPASIIDLALDAASEFHSFASQAGIPFAWQEVIIKTLSENSLLLKP